MSTTEAKKPLITGVVRLTYANRIWEAGAMDDDDPNSKKKFGTGILISKSDKKTVAEINKRIEEAIQEGIRTKWNGKKPAKLKLPLRDGDEEHAEKEEYTNQYFLNANSDRQPGIGKKIDGVIHAITNRDEMQSGDYVIASLTFYPFTGKQNGIAVGLQNLLKVRTGDHFGGGTNMDEDFANVEVPAEDDGSDLL